NHVHLRAAMYRTSSRLESTRAVPPSVPIPLLSSSATSPTKQPKPEAPAKGEPHACRFQMIRDLIASRAQQEVEERQDARQGRGHVSQGGSVEHLADRHVFLRRH